jgi:hypothetical protein
LALLAEIMILVVIPAAYIAFLMPKPAPVLNQTFPLTNDEIKTAWPNLPTADMIAGNASSAPYLSVDPSCTLTYNVQNCTVLNIPNFFQGGLVPKSYHIWLQYNGTRWVEVPLAYLTTSNPPITPPEQQVGFLGTGLPTEYGILAVAAVVATLVIGTGFLMRRKSCRRVA